MKGLHFYGNRLGVNSKNTIRSVKRETPTKINPIDLKIKETESVILARNC